MIVDAIHYLIERFGLIAVFLGCIAEGESAAILGGFFAHQGTFEVWQVFAAAFVGSFLGDALFFLAGKYLSDSSFVRKLHRRPDFAYARRMVQAYPAPYVLLNRYIYGFRLIGGIVAGFLTSACRNSWPSMPSPHWFGRFFSSASDMSSAWAPNRSLARSLPSMSASCSPWGSA